MKGMRMIIRSGYDRSDMKGMRMIIRESGYERNAYDKKGVGVIGGDMKGMHMIRREWM
jgi:hypothetical protein